MRNHILKTVVGVALGLSCSGVANAAKDPEIMSVTDRGTWLEPCRANIIYQADQNRNVSGGYDFIQYQIIGIHTDGHEQNFSPYGSFSWDWVSGVNDVNTAVFYGPWINTSVWPVSYEIRFFNGTEQSGTVGPHLATFELENLCNRNTPPVADAGEDIYYAVPNLQVFLDGSASSDPDEDVLSYSWTQTAGPEVELIDAETAAPSFFYPPGQADQEIEFELIVNDGTVDSEPDTVVVIHNGRSNGNAIGHE